MTNWNLKEIHPDFTEKLQEQWESKGFNEKEVKDWIKVGIWTWDIKFAHWLKEEKKYTANWVRDSGNIKELRGEYKEWEIEKTFFKIEAEVEDRGYQISESEWADYWNELRKVTTDDDRWKIKTKLFRKKSAELYSQKIAESPNPTFLTKLANTAINSSSYDFPYNHDPEAWKILLTSEDEKNYSYRLREHEEKLKELVNKNKEELEEIRTRWYYEVLEAEEEASPNQIKENYRKLSLVYHPDRRANKPEEEKKEAEKKMKKLNDAYKTLGDENLRKKYDLCLMRVMIDFEEFWLSEKKWIEYQKSEAKVDSHFGRKVASVLQDELNRHLLTTESISIYSNRWQDEDFAKFHTQEEGLTQFDPEAAEAAIKAYNKFSEPEVGLLKPEEFCSKIIFGKLHYEAIEDAREYLGIIDWIVNGVMAQFKTRLNKSLKIGERHFERHFSGLTKEELEDVKDLGEFNTKEKCLEKYQDLEMKSNLKITDEEYEDSSVFMDEIGEKLRNLKDGKEKLLQELEETIKKGEELLKNGKEVNDFNTKFNDFLTLLREGKNYEVEIERMVADGEEEYAWGEEEIEDGLPEKWEKYNEAKRMQPKLITILQPVELKSGVMKRVLEQKTEEILELQVKLDEQLTKKETTGWKAFYRWLQTDITVSEGLKVKIRPEKSSQYRGISELTLTDFCNSLEATLDNDANYYLFPEFDETKTFSELFVYENTYFGKKTGREANPNENDYQVLVKLFGEFSKREERTSQENQDENTISDFIPLTKPEKQTIINYLDNLIFTNFAKLKEEKNEASIKRIKKNTLSPELDYEEPLKNANNWGQAEDIRAKAIKNIGEKISTSSGGSDETLNKKTEEILKNLAAELKKEIKEQLKIKDLSPEQEKLLEVNVAEEINNTAKKLTVSKRRILSEARPITTSDENRQPEVTESDSMNENDEKQTNNPLPKESENQETPTQNLQSNQTNNNNIDKNNMSPKKKELTVKIEGTLNIDENKANNEEIIFPKTPKTPGLPTSPRSFQKKEADKFKKQVNTFLQRLITELDDRIIFFNLRDNNKDYYKELGFTEGFNGMLKWLEKESKQDLTFFQLLIRDTAVELYNKANEEARKTFKPKEEIPAVLLNYKDIEELRKEVEEAKTATGGTGETNDSTWKETFIKTLLGEEDSKTTDNDNEKTQHLLKWAESIKRVADNLKTFESEAQPPIVIRYEPTETNFQWEKNWVVLYDFLSNFAWKDIVARWHDYKYDEDYDGEKWVDKAGYKKRLEEVGFPALAGLLRTYEKSEENWTKNCRNENLADVLKETGLMEDDFPEFSEEEIKNEEKDIQEGQRRATLLKQFRDKLKKDLEIDIYQADGKAENEKILFEVLNTLDWRDIKKNWNDRTETTEDGNGEPTVIKGYKSKLTNRMLEGLISAANLWENRSELDKMEPEVVNLTGIGENPGSDNPNEFLPEIKRRAPILKQTHDKLKNKLGIDIYAVAKEDEKNWEQKIDNLIEAKQWFEKIFGVNINDFSFGEFEHINDWKEKVKELLGVMEEEDGDLPEIESFYTFNNTKENQDDTPKSLRELIETYRQNEENNLKSERVNKKMKSLLNALGYKQTETEKKGDQLVNVDFLEKLHPSQPDKQTYWSAFIKNKLGDKTFADTNQKLSDLIATKTDFDSLIDDLGFSSANFDRKNLDLVKKKFQDKKTGTKTVLGIVDEANRYQDIINEKNNTDILTDDNFDQTKLDALREKAKKNNVKELTLKWKGQGIAGETMPYGEFEVIANNRFVVYIDDKTYDSYEGSEYLYKGEKVRFYCNTLEFLGNLKEIQKGGTFSLAFDGEIARDSDNGIIQGFKTGSWDWNRVYLKGDKKTLILKWKGRTDSYETFEIISSDDNVSYHYDYDDNLNLDTFDFDSDLLKEVKAGDIFQFTFDGDLNKDKARIYKLSRGENEYSEWKKIISRPETANKEVMTNQPQSEDTTQDSQNTQDQQETSETPTTQSAQWKDDFIKAVLDQDISDLKDENEEKIKKIISQSPSIGKGIQRLKDLGIVHIDRVVAVEESKKYVWEKDLEDLADILITLSDLRSGWESEEEPGVKDGEKKIIPGWKDRLAAINNPSFEDLLAAHEVLEKFHHKLKGNFGIDIYQDEDWAAQVDNLLEVKKWFEDIFIADTSKFEPDDSWKKRVVYYLGEKEITKSEMDRRDWELPEADWLKKNDKLFTFADAKKGNVWQISLSELVKMYGVEERKTEQLNSLLKTIGYEIPTEEGGEEEEKKQPDAELRPDPFADPEDANSEQIYWSLFKQNKIGRKNFNDTNKTFEQLINDSEAAAEYEKKLKVLLADGEMTPESVSADSKWEEKLVKKSAVGTDNQQENEELRKLQTERDNWKARAKETAVDAREQLKVHQDALIEACDDALTVLQHQQGDLDDADINKQIKANDTDNNTHYWTNQTEWQDKLQINNPAFNNAQELSDYMLAVSAAIETLKEKEKEKKLNETKSDLLTNLQDNLLKNLTITDADINREINQIFKADFIMGTDNWRDFLADGDNGLKINNHQQLVNLASIVTQAINQAKINQNLKVAKNKALTDLKILQGTLTDGDIAIKAEQLDNNIILVGGDWKNKLKDTDDKIKNPKELTHYVGIITQAITELKGTIDGVADLKAAKADALTYLENLQGTTITDDQIKTVANTAQKGTISPADDWKKKLQDTDNRLANVQQLTQYINTIVGVISNLKGTGDIENAKKHVVNRLDILKGTLKDDEITVAAEIVEPNSTNGAAWTQKLRANDSTIFNAEQLAHYVKVITQAINKCQADHNLNQAKAQTIVVLQHLAQKAGLADKQINTKLNLAPGTNWHDKLQQADRELADAHQLAQYTDQIIRIIATEAVAKTDFDKTKGERDDLENQIKLVRRELDIGAAVADVVNNKLKAADLQGHKQAKNDLTARENEIKTAIDNNANIPNGWQNGVKADYNKLKAKFNNTANLPNNWENDLVKKADLDTEKVKIATLKNDLRVIKADNSIDTVRVQQIKDNELELNRINNDIIAKIKNQIHLGNLIIVDPVDNKDKIDDARLATIEATLGTPANTAVGEVAKYKVKLQDLGIAAGQEEADDPWDKELMNKKPLIQAGYSDFDAMLADLNSLKTEKTDFQNKLSAKEEHCRKEKEALQTQIEQKEQELLKALVEELKLGLVSGKYERSQVLTKIKELIADKGGPNCSVTAHTDYDAIKAERDTLKNENTQLKNRKNDDNKENINKDALRDTTNTNFEKWGIKLSDEQKQSLINAASAQKVEEIRNGIINVEMSKLKGENKSAFALNIGLGALTIGSLLLLFRVIARESNLPKTEPKKGK